MIKIHEIDIFSFVSALALLLSALYSIYVLYAFNRLKNNFKHKKNTRKIDVKYGDLLQRSLDFPAYGLVSISHLTESNYRDELQELIAGGFLNDDEIIAFNNSYGNNEVQNNVATYTVEKSDEIITTYKD